MSTAEWTAPARFEIGELIGSGGMGRVYRGFDREQRRAVAVKMLKHQGPDALVRFKNEFRALRDVQHRNLVTLGELIESDGRWFFTMELIEGAVSFVAHVRDILDDSRDTEAHLEMPTTPMLPGELDLGTPSPITHPVRGQLDEARLRAGLIQVAEALVTLHRAGKVHLDIKPSNVLVARDGRVVVLDFGIVADVGHVTAGGAKVIGTPAYMAPEQARGEPPGPASDWYSLGVMLYEALTGQTPFRGKHSQILELKQHYDPLAPGVLARVPRDLELLCLSLLERTPSARPTGEQVLARLGVGSTQVSIAPPADVFVGRDEELGELHRAALDALRAGTTLVLEGESGVGKSALVRQFQSELTRRDHRALVLTGRCGERESVPFKGLDGVMDAMRDVLERGDPTKPLLDPVDRRLLAHAFPVFGEESDAANGEARVDPHELRDKVFSAARRAFEALAQDRHLVIVIDDFQWADADSVTLISRVMQAPAPRLLLVISQRPANAAMDGHARRLGATRKIGLRALSKENAVELAMRLLPGSVAPDVIASVASDAGGHPLFTMELARMVGGGPLPGRTVSLDEAIRLRIEKLDAPAQRMLEVVALAGEPIPRDVALRASGLDPALFARHLDDLRRVNLMRAAGPASFEVLDAYHHRIQHAVAARVSAEESVLVHRRLADALAASGQADPETLAMHWERAGDRQRAAALYAEAAARATRTVAFDRAVRFYQRAVSLDRTLEHGLTPALAEAFANAGRSHEAARAFLSASESAGAGAEATRFRWKAAEQLLKSGHFDDGIRLLTSALEENGIDLPRTPLASAASLVYAEMRLRVRGLEPRHHDEPPSAAALARLDLEWAATNSLIGMEPTRGFALQKRGLYEALEVGEPVRLSRSMSMEAIVSAAGGSVNQHRTIDLVERATMIARRVGTPEALAWAEAAAGLNFVQRGIWRPGVEYLDRCINRMIEGAGITGWEVDSVLMYKLRALAFLGEIEQLRAETAKRMSIAEARGDLFAATNLKTGFPSMTLLADDRPGDARRAADEAIRVWTGKAFHLQHYLHVVAVTHADLYEGDGASAHRCVLEMWPALRRSFLLPISQFLRIHGRELRGRAALALCRGPHDRRERLLREVEQDAQLIDREGRPWGRGLALLLRAGVEHRRGRIEPCAKLLREATVSLDGAEMSLHAAAARHRLGKILGGDQGREVLEAAERELRARTVIAPDRMASMLVPGVE